MLLRSQLYVPANEEKKIRKSVALDCDSIVFDLEDAVPSIEKINARNTLKRLLNELDWKDKQLGIRVNKEGVEYSAEDIDEFKSESKISFLVLPKAEDNSGKLAERAGKALLPLVETARGLLRVEDIIRAEGVFAVGYGAADFASSVEGKTRVYLDNVYVKTKLVVAARSYGVDPIDNVFFDLADQEGFKKEAMQSRDLGYVGKQVIHPSQIQIANAVYSPTAQEIEEAKRIVEAYERGTRDRIGVLRINEQLIDAVHYRQAKVLLKKVQNPT